MYTEYKTTIDIGRELAVEVQATGSFEIHNNYGADSDGNRGINVFSINIKELIVFDMSGNNITAKLYKGYRIEFNKLAKDAIERLVESI